LSVFKLSSLRIYREVLIDVLGVPTVEVNPSDLSIDAHGEITAPAQFAYETVSAMPADADMLTGMCRKFLVGCSIGSTFTSTSRR
jgi:hypothetical protein